MVGIGRVVCGILGTLSARDMSLAFLEVSCHSYFALLFALVSYLGRDLKIFRILIVIVWYGVQAFTGGQLLGVILSTIFPTYHHMKNTLPASASMTTKQFVGYVIYNISR